LTVSEEQATIKSRIGEMFNIHPELIQATPNERLIAFWKMWNGFGDRTLDPKELTNYHSIDRAFRRIIPDGFKNYSKAEEYREHFAKLGDT